MEKIIKAKCWMCGNIFAMKISCPVKFLDEVEKEARSKLFHEIKEHQKIKPINTREGVV